MTTNVDPDPDPDGDVLDSAAREQTRQAIEDALLAFRPDVQERFRELLDRPVLQPAEALRMLADRDDIPRVLKHRILIDGLRRLGRAPDDPDLQESARRLLESTVDTGGAGDPRSERQGRLAKRHLDAVVAMDGERRMQSMHWQEWVRRTNRIYHYSTEERTLATCDDEHTAVKETPDHRQVDSRLIAAEFWSDSPPAAFREYVQPKYWPSCSSFWKSMVKLVEPTPVPGGYDCDYLETVRIFGTELAVPLHVGFRERPDGSRLWTRFNLSRRPEEAAAPVDVDTGTISAQRVAGGPAQTRVRATKYLHWRPGRGLDLSELSCDFGWSDLMVEMAVKAGGSTAAPEPTATASAADAAVHRLVGDVAAECREGIRDSEPGVEQLLRRFTGPTWDGAWITDLLGLGQDAVRRYGRIAGHVRRFAASVGSDDDAGAKQ